MLGTLPHKLTTEFLQSDIQTVDLFGGSHHVLFTALHAFEDEGELLHVRQVLRETPTHFLNSLCSTHAFTGMFQR